MTDQKTALTKAISIRLTIQILIDKATADENTITIPYFQHTLISCKFDLQNALKSLDAYINTVEKYGNHPDMT